jgi:hypothetical protein
MISDAYGIASRANGSDRGMRERASTMPVGSIAKRSWVGLLATVGRPYKLPPWSTVWEDLLTSNPTLCGSEIRADSSGD